MDVYDGLCAFKYMFWAGTYSKGGLTSGRWHLAVRAAVAIAALTPENIPQQSLSARSLPLSHSMAVLYRKFPLKMQKQWRSARLPWLTARCWSRRARSCRAALRERESEPNTHTHTHTKRSTIRPIDKAHCAELWSDQSTQALQIEFQWESRTAFYRVRPLTRVWWLVAA